MKKIKWILTRLSIMSFPEIIFRIREFILVFIMRIKYVLGPGDEFKISEENLVFFKNEEIFFKLPWDKIDEEHIKDGIFFSYGSNLEWLNEDNFWHNQIGSDNQWPKSFFSDIDIKPNNAVGDIRLLWEPARLQHLPVIAKFISSDCHHDLKEKYLNIIEEQLCSFLRHNPKYSGPHYVSSMECGLRIISLVHMLDQMRPYIKNKNKILTFSLMIINSHADFINHRISLFSSAGNHTICECAGLLYAGLIFPEFKKSSTWVKKALPIFEFELDRQILSDGGGIEQSIWYHYFITNIGLVVESLLIKNKISSLKIKNANSRAKNFFNSSFLGVHDLPPIGDSDNGYVLSKYCDLVFNKSSLNIKTNDKVVTHKETGMSIFFPRNYVETLYFNHGPFGMTPAFGHGHADALSVCLHSRGERIVCDTGTYGYNLGSNWREYFRSTKAQNTISINGEDQAEQVGPFIWKNVNSSKLHWVGKLGEYETVIAKFDWAHKFPFIHYRACINIAPGDWFFWDYISGSSQGEFKLYWHTPNKLFQEGNTFHWNNISEGFFKINGAHDINLIVGSENPIAGWASREYGEKKPITTIVGAYFGQAPHEFTTIIRYGDSKIDSSGLNEEIINQLKKLLYEKCTV